MKRSLAVALVLALAAPLFLLGCGKDNPVKPKIDPQPIIYPDQSTPENTLRRMAIAFASRDSVMTDSVYADDYEGTSIDMTDPIPATDTFSKSDEVSIVANLAKSTSITFINLDFGPQETWYEFIYASDPPDWITIQVPNFRVEVQDVHGNGFTASAPSPGETWTFEFTLRPIIDVNSPAGDTWAIVRWVESRDHN